MSNLYSPKKKKQRSYELAFLKKNYEFYDNLNFTAADYSASSQEEFWMNKALKLAYFSKSLNEVPVGALIVDEDNNLLAEGYNQVIYSNDISCHAEIVAIKNASKKLKNYRLVGATLYVTLEPCLMCFGALVQARIRRVVFGACDPKLGIMSKGVIDILQKSLNHKVIWQSNVLENACREVLQDFFYERR